ncbi:unnamed protein product [Durusdinium trenchii]|uniref:Isochorismatase-like domain-containing protein n=1 Tax=Durusdinium trenchii TaxID=1381693 RepID=A0ABP0QP94_9DINO
MMYIKHINQTDRLCQSDPRQLPRLATRLSSRLPMSVKLSRQRTVSCLAAALFGRLWCSQTLLHPMAKDQDSPKPRAALLLIDMQKAFTTGSWASYFGGRKEVTDIERACEEAAILLKSGRLPSETPILCTKCYLDRAQDEPYLEILEPLLRKRPCIHKPTMDVTYNPAFFQWLHEQVEKGISVLVIGGCTTTSCVRVSSTEIVGQLEEQGLTGKLRVVVDLKLCGARTENFQPTAEAAPVLVQIYGRELCRGKSAVDLAVVQMKRAGVEVLEGWDW